MYRHKLLLLFPAMMRSGHHAIIYWIQSHFSKPQYELNDVNPFQAPRWSRRHQSPNPDTLTNLATVNFEDVNLHRCRNERLFESHYVGGALECRTVLVLRDPYNLLASKLQLNRTRKWASRLSARRAQSPQKLVELWKVHAREFTGETSFLGENVVRISFNHWFKSVAYRDTIAAQLRFENTDSALNTVSERGTGSSFDYLQLKNRAQQMDVMNRWRQFATDEEFRFIWKDREVALLNDRFVKTLKR